MAVDHPPEYALELQYPPAKRHKGLSSMTDIQAWEYSDEEIITAARETWRSPVYDHYNIHLERRLTSAGTPDSLVFRFECKHSPRDHAPQYRERLKTGAGTHNLLASAKRCDERRNGGKTQSGSQPATPAPGPGPRTQRAQSITKSPQFSEAKHRALLAMRACIEHVPPSTVVDGMYQMFADFLRPGTKVPSGETVAKDIEGIYSGTSKAIYDHLQQIPGALHLAIDGWTNPTSSDVAVGIVIFWYENSQLWRALLDVVWVGVLDADDHLADRVLECLKEYGIEGKIMSVCLNNAPQNEKLVAQLAEFVPSFRGAKSRVRDLPQTVGLMSKAFMSFFYPPSLEINIKAPDSPAVDSSDADQGDSATELELTKSEYEDYVIQTTTAEAQTKMAATGITIPDSVLSNARRLMLKISGLARHMDEVASSQLRHTLRELVKQDPDLAIGLDERPDDLDPDSPPKSILTRRIASQWNTDRDALESHLSHKEVIQKLISADTDDSRELKKYALDGAQWKLVNELSSVLEVFHELISRFSYPSIPLVHEAYPELLSLRARLQDIRDDFFKVGLSPVTRVAAQASLLVFDKFMGPSEDSDVYDIAVAMRPDYKLKWFSERGYDVEHIRAHLIERFNDTYASEISDAGSSTSVKALTPSAGPKPRSIWTQRHSSSTSTSPKTDTIEHYLLQPALVPSEIVDQGGPIAYWTSQLQVQPRVARMALDYLTTPASSVDSERAFSGARIQTYGLDEGDTFRAQMCIPTWYKTPLLPDVQDTYRIIEGHMQDESH